VLVPEIAGKLPSPSTVVRKRFWPGLWERTSGCFLAAWCERKWRFQRVSRVVWFELICCCVDLLDLF